jgi:hypothetical protein
MFDPRRHPAFGTPSRAPAAAAAAPPASANDRGRASVSACACGGSCPRCASAGLALAAPIRSTMEERLGTSLADVRIHADTPAAQAAARANAHAFTIGSDIFFGAGRFAPHTSEGATRLAHELVHVAQQRAGRHGAPHADARRAECEARRLGAAAAAGERVSVQAAAAPAMQRDGPGDAPAPSPDGLPGLQLQLDPEILRLALQHYVRWWLGTTLIEGEAPTALPEPGAADEYDTPREESPDLRLPPSFTFQMPLQQPFFSPLPPDPLFIEPDVGSLYSAFGTRGAPVGEGDSLILNDIYRRNQAIVGALPDLRGMAPDFLRPLIPITWRRDIAGALVGADVNARLNRDYMTPIEVSDRAWQGMTGASTTVIPFPSFSF